MQRFTACAVLALVALGTPAAAEQRETETFDRTISFAEGGRLRLRSFSGEVRITGRPGNDVVIHAVRRATRERLDNIKLEVTVSGDLIDIEANKKAPGWRDRNNNVVDTDFEIQVPSRTELDVHTFSSDVEVTGVQGRQKVYAFSGKLILRDATGPIEAETFSGSIDVDVTAAAEVPSLEVETFSGDVKARVPPAGGGRIEFNGFSGSFDAEMPVVFKSSSSKHIKAEFGSGNALLRFKTFSGSVRLLK